MRQIPDPLVKAFIAIEDRRFYQHRGVDFQGITRAFTSNVMSGEVSQGGSTITQQLARTAFLDSEQSILRKLREVRLSQKIEQELSKSQILERYLNLVYLGSGAYGVADAAWVYFGKSVNQLTLPEMATLAGLPPAPSDYSPLLNSKTALQRRNLVLQRMQEVGFITAAEAEAASSTPLVTNPKRPRRLQVAAPYFTSYVQQQLPKYISSDKLKAGGLTVETTLNAEWQQAAETTLKNTGELNGSAQNFDQAALVAIDPRSGEVKAMVGGFDFATSSFNRVTQARRQPGSTFKAFVYTAAIAAGLSPYKSYLDAPYTVDGYKPENYGDSHRGWVAMPDALARSINVVAVKVLIDVGFNPAIKLAHQMGIQSELRPFYSLALGANEVTLFEMASAFGTLATQGMHTPPHGIRRVLDRQGKVIYDANFKPKRVLDQGSASIMTWMLGQVVAAGTGGPAQLGRPVAGKTGTSEKARDLWFIGYIPQVVTGVWLGNDNDEPTGGSSGTAAITWRRFMAEVVEEMPVETFPELPNLEGRKGSIKAEPVRPKRAYTGSWNTEENDTDDSSSSPSNSGFRGNSNYNDSNNYNYRGYRGHTSRRYRRRSRARTQNTQVEGGRDSQSQTNSSGSQSTDSQTTSEPAPSSAEQNQPVSQPTAPVETTAPE
jgi:penicillin-binding protein 1A